jgi:hypothetical protein
VLDALEQHLDDNQDDFDRWFCGPKSNLVSQIAKRKKALFGELERNVVNQILAEQGWLAYRYVGDCVHTAMYLFRKLLPEPLSEAEGRLFERMHLRQDCFGGLPAAMIAERLSLLHPILPQVFQEPDNTLPVAVMHRLLDYYGEMAVARRDADKKAAAMKASARQRGRETAVELNLADRDEEEGPDSILCGTPTCQTDTDPRLGDLAELIAARLGAECACEEPTWELHCEAPEQENVDVSLYCRGCGAERSGRVSKSQLRQAACPPVG